jgi:4-carboxymuconolactone decarboxylase
MAATVEGTVEMTSDDVPSDIDPQSGNRLPLPRREDLDERTRPIFDRLADAGGGSLAGLQGPGGIRLHSPRMAAALHETNQYLRAEAGIEPAVRELAILVTARENECQFEWAAHEPAAVAAGVTTDVIETVRHRRDTKGLGETEAIVIRLGREIFAAHRVSSETFAAALRLFGQRGLVDVVSLMGQYAATAAVLIAFDQQLRPGQEPPLP